MTTDNEAAAVEVGRIPTPCDPWQPINELEMSNDLFWFLGQWDGKSWTVDGPREPQSGGYDHDEWDYFCPAEAPPTIAAHTAASAGEVVAYTKDNGPGKVVGLEWNPYYSVHELRGRVPLYTTLPAAVPADALERLVEKWCGLAKLCIGDDSGVQVAAATFEVCADELAALIPKGAV